MSRLQICPPALSGICKPSPLLAGPPTPPLGARGNRARLLEATNFFRRGRGGCHCPHRRGRPGLGWNSTPAPLPWVALTLLRFARLNATAILPTPPGLDAARPVPKYQIPALQGPAVGLAPALHPGFSGGTDTLVLITSSSGSPIPGSPPLLAWVSCPRVTRNYSTHKI